MDQMEVSTPNRTPSRQKSPAEDPPFQLARLGKPSGLHGDALAEIWAPGRGFFVVLRLEVERIELSSLNNFSKNDYMLIVS